MAGRALGSAHLKAVAATLRPTTRALSHLRNGGLGAVGHRRAVAAALAIAAWTLRPALLGHGHGALRDGRSTSAAMMRATVMRVMAADPSYRPTLAGSCARFPPPLAGCGVEQYGELVKRLQEHGPLGPPSGRRLHRGQHRAGAGPGPSGMGNVRSRVTPISSAPRSTAWVAIRSSRKSKSSWPPTTTSPRAWRTPCC